MMSMMDGLGEATTLAPSSPNYTTPPQIPSPSPSTQLTACVFDTSTPGLFFPSSASHTLFPPASIADAVNAASNNLTGQSDDDDNDDEDEDDADEATPSSPEDRAPVAAAPAPALATTAGAAAEEEEEASTAPQASSSIPNLTDADLEAIIANPWTAASRTEFHQKFNPALNPQYKNKLRLAPEAEARVRHFLLHPSSPLDPNSPSDARLKARSRSYTLHPFGPMGDLYRTETTHSSPAASGSTSSSAPASSAPGTDMWIQMPTGLHVRAPKQDVTTTMRRHVSAREVWDLLTSEHVKSGHKGRDRMLGLIKDRFVGYTLEELMFVLGSCRVCARARGVGGGGVELAQRVRRSLGVLGVAQPQLQKGHEEGSLMDAAPMMPGRQSIDAGAGGEGDGARVGPLSAAQGGEQAQQQQLAQHQLSIHRNQQQQHHHQGTFSSVPLGVMQQRLQANQHLIQTQQRLSNKRLAYGNVGDLEPPVAPPPVKRRPLFAPDESGMVVYDVPDWYF